MTEFNADANAITVPETPPRMNLADYVAALMDFSDKLEFSDILLESDGEVRYRIPSGWTATDYGVISVFELKEFIEDIRKLTHSGEMPTTPMNNISVGLGNWRVRMNIFTTLAGLKTKVVIRKLPNRAPTLKQIGLGLRLGELVEAQHGLVIVSGPTGVGKSTTMAAIMQAKLDSQRIHAITIEEPIEYVFEDGMGIVSQREVGSDVASFEEGLIEALRQRPDVILIGEVRTRAEAETAIRSAEHGRFVIMSTHGRDSMSAIAKLLSFFPADEQTAKAASIARHLVCALHQALLPAASGYGWVLAYEALLPKGDKQILSQLSDPSKYETLRESISSGSMNTTVPLNRNLANLVANGTVFAADAIAASNDVPNLKVLLEENSPKGSR